MTDPIQIDGHQSPAPKIFTHQEHQIGGYSTPATPIASQNIRKDDATNAHIEWEQQQKPTIIEWPEPHLDLPPSNLAPVVKRSNKQTGKAGEALVVQRGFGPVPLTPCHKCDLSQARIFPALSNDGYAQATANVPVIYETFPKEPYFDGAAFVQEKLSIQKAIDLERNLSDQQASDREDEAHVSRAVNTQQGLVVYEPCVKTRVATSKSFGIKFNRCDGGSVLDDYGALFSLDLDPEVQRAQYIEDAAKDKAVGDSPLTFCSVCKHKHIPWGPPLTLPDRDTCGSLLPQWFPRHLFDDPWTVFRLFTNALVSYEEIEAGILPDLIKKKEWNLRWHETDQAWRSIGRPPLGFWAKCRTGEEVGADDGFAAKLEISCKVCHMKGRVGQQEKEQNEHWARQKDRAAAHKKRRQADCKFLFELAGRQDKALVLARERARCAREREQLEAEYVSDDDMWQSAQARRRSQDIMS